MWPFKKKALTGSPAVLDALRDRSMQPFPLLGGGNRQRIQDAYNTAKSADYAWIYTNSPAVRTVVDVLVRNIGQLDLRLYEEVSEDNRRPKPEHPAALSLRYPNEETSSDSLIRSLIKDKLVFDDAYAVLEPAIRQQITLNWVPAHMVEIRGSSLFRAEGYRVHRRDGTWVDFQPENMLHWHGENPHDPRMGLSKLDTLRAVIAEDAALQQATVELANAGLTEPAWVYRPLEAPEWDNDARKGFEEDLTNRMRRRNKTPVVLEEGMELRSFGVNPKDAEMMAVRRWAIERVAAVYGVPLGMVGLADNLAEAQTQFYSDTLPPYCEEFTKMLNQRILVREYAWTDGCFEFNLDEKLMGNERIKTLISASGAPVLTRNESRAKLNMPPVDGGEELITPANVLVGANPKPSVDVMPIQDPNGPPQDGSARSGDNPTQIPPPKADEFEAGTDVLVAGVQLLLRRLYDRQQRSYGNRKRFDGDRFSRELASDLMALVPGVDERAAIAATSGMHDGVQEVLDAGGDYVQVFESARQSSAPVAARLVSMLRMDARELRDLGVPDEVVWERAGFSAEEIDRMRALQLSERLLDASGEH